MTYFHVSNNQISNGSFLVGGKNQLRGYYMMHELSYNLNQNSDINYIKSQYEALKYEAARACNNDVIRAKQYATDKMPEVCKCMTEGLYEKLRKTKYSSQYSRYDSVYLFKDDDSMNTFLNKHPYTNKYEIDLDSTVKVESYDMRVFEKTCELMCDLLCEKDETKHASIYKDIIATVDEYWSGKMSSNPLVECLVESNKVKVIKSI